ncbi:hypothetical protein BDW22DRAFT_1361121 [Trametopsis cervina]|nr:hypothetical protein BDW22DRAFT_1361121 [Trametopsis cervina]
MSSKAIAAATTHFLQFRIQWASLALLYFDYVLTLKAEIKYIWSKSSLHRLSTVLYVLCRYALLCNVLYLLAISNKLGSSCNTWYKFLSAVSVLGRAAVLTVFTMRTYAMWSKNKFILCGLGAIAVTCVVLDCIHVPGLRCQGSSTIQIANTLLSILVCVFEFSSTILTTIRCIQAVKAAGSVESQKNTFTYLILEQGVLYFGIVSIFTTAAVILNFRAPSGFFQRLLNALTLPISGLLTARFLLHMREWDNRHTFYSNNHATTDIAMDDAQFAHASTLRTLERTIVSEFGEDPVFARPLSHGSSTEAESFASEEMHYDQGDANGPDAEKWVGFEKEQQPSGSVKEIKPEESTDTDEVEEVVPVEVVESRRPSVVEIPAPMDDAGRHSLTESYITSTSVTRNRLSVSSA